MQEYQPAVCITSPAQDGLDYAVGVPGAQEYYQARQLRAQQAAEIRRSYDQQIQQKHDMEAEYLLAESKWPYGPQHRPESKCAYLSSPRYVKPSYVQTPVKL